MRFCDITYVAISNTVTKEIFHFGICTNRTIYFVDCDLICLDSDVGVSSRYFLWGLSLDLFSKVL